MQSCSQDEKLKNNNQQHWLVRLWNYFTLYEKIWFASLIILAIVLAFVLPEEDANGVSGTVITILYFFDVAIGIMCELLTSKQNRWSFLIYNIVEVIEITTMIILQARFASIAVALFFWIPIHTASFIVWTKHKDEKEKTKTVVRSLKVWQSLILVGVVVVWTFGIGYLMAAYAPGSEFFASEQLEQLSAYLDACLSILSIIDGILLLFRFTEAWYIWYIYIAIETVYNIVFGQWVLLVYKLGYLINTTYGLILWNKYIKKRNAMQGKDTEENAVEEQKQDNIESGTTNEIVIQDEANENKSLENN